MAIRGHALPTTCTARNQSKLTLVAVSDSWSRNPSSLYRVTLVPPVPIGYQAFWDSNRPAGTVYFATRAIVQGESTRGPKNGPSSLQGNARNQAAEGYRALRGGRVFSAGPDRPLSQLYEILRSSRPITIATATALALHQSRHIEPPSPRTKVQ
jgi:hypothetical protein